MNYMKILKKGREKGEEEAKSMPHQETGVSGENHRLVASH
jgi:hypothetical protein